LGVIHPKHKICVTLVISFVPEAARLETIPTIKLGTLATALIGGLSSATPAVSLVSLTLRFNTTYPCIAMDALSLQPAASTNGPIVTMTSWT
jgi:hypothetical protein